MPTSQNLASEPLEIAPGTWWVGRRPQGDIFYANPYLRVFQSQEPGRKTFALLLDPGSNKEFAVVRSKVEQVIGSVDRVGGVFVNHQDPDVASSVGTILGRHNPKAWVLCTEDTWRLVHYYNIPREQFVPIERYAHGLQFPNGEALLPVPSPFCHFVGAMMLYDPQTRILFTGDLFGGLTAREAEGLWADESDWAGVRAFHQIYMPTNKALRQAIARIRRLKPAPEILAPQHGRLLRGPWLAECLDRLEALPVGLDLMEDLAAPVVVSDSSLRAWNTGRVCRPRDRRRGQLPARLEHCPLPGRCAGRRAARRRGRAAPPRRQRHAQHAGGAQGRLGHHRKRQGHRRARAAPAHRGPAPRVANPIKYEAINAAAELDLPTPAIEVEESSGVRPDDEFRAPAFNRFG